MIKTKASFRALREECGLTQEQLADEMDVDRRSVKRWESPHAPVEPPDDVWAWLLAARGAMHEDARLLAEQIVENYRETGAREITLLYYRSQQDLDAVQLGGDIDEPVGYANARMRLIARLLEQQEIPYHYEYAGE